MAAAKITEEVKNVHTLIGQHHYDEKLDSLQTALNDAVTELKRLNGDPPSDISGLSIYDIARQELEHQSDNIPGGMGIQTKRVLANQEANELQRDIMQNRLRGDVDLYGRGARGNNPAIIPLFDRSDAGDTATVNRLNAYRDSENNTEAQKAFLETMRIFGTFTEDQRRRLNENNSINAAIPDVMTDRTGQQLLEAIRNLQVTINVP